MEIIVLGIFGLVVWALIRAAAGEWDSNASAAAAAGAQSTQFTCKVDLTTIDLGEGNTVPAFKVRVRGQVFAPSEQYPFCFVVAMREVDADGKEIPVLCSIEQLRLKESPFFRFESAVSYLPYSSSLISDYIDVVAVPTAVLTFSQKGWLKLRFIVGLVGALEERTLAHATREIVYENKESGYMDLANNRRIAEELAIKLSLLVAAVDGKRDEEEAEIIRAWIRSRTKEFPADEQGQHRDRFNQYVREVFSITDADTIRTTARILCARGQDLSKSEKFDILDLMLKIAGADGTASKAELLLLNEVSGLLGLDQKAFRDMRDKALPLNMHEVAVSNELEDLDHLLGISATMSAEEKKRHLNSEYRKWNARTSSSDQKIRDQARLMIRKISEYRKTLSE